MGQRLIDANKLVLRFEYGIQEDGLLFVPFRDIKKSVNRAPTVDAVPVVRCLDCRNSYEGIDGRICSFGPCVDCVVPDDYFCRFGERSDDDGCQTGKT